MEIMKPWCPHSSSASWKRLPSRSCGPSFQILDCAGSRAGSRASRQPRVAGSRCCRWDRLPGHRCSAGICGSRDPTSPQQVSRVGCHQQRAVRVHVVKRMAVLADHLWALAFSLSLLRDEIGKHSREEVAHDVITPWLPVVAQRHSSIVGPEPLCGPQRRAATLTSHLARDTPDIEAGAHHVAGAAGDRAVPAALKVVFVQFVSSINHSIK